LDEVRDGDLDDWPLGNAGYGDLRLGSLFQSPDWLVGGDGATVVVPNNLNNDNNDNNDNNAQNANDINNDNNAAGPAPASAPAPTPALAPAPLSAEAL